MAQTDEMAMEKCVLAKEYFSDDDDYAIFSMSKFPYSPKEYSFTQHCIFKNMLYTRTHMLAGAFSDIDYEFPHFILLKVERILHILCGLGISEKYVGYQKKYNEAYHAAFKANAWEEGGEWENYRNSFRPEDPVIYMVNAPHKKGICGNEVCEYCRETMMLIDYAQLQYNLVKHLQKLPEWNKLVLWESFSETGHQPSILKLSVKLFMELLGKIEVCQDDNGTESDSDVETDFKEKS